MFGSFNQEDADYTNLVENILVNLPHSLRSNQFIIDLTDSSDTGIFETKTVHTIIDFKWETYTQNFFRS